MRYAYYPGCSLEATGRPYEESVQAIAKALGIELVELDDWNCCGATAYMSVNEILSFSLTARNLGQAKKTGDTLLKTSVSSRMSPVMSPSVWRKNTCASS